MVVHVERWSQCIGCQARIAVTGPGRPPMRCQACERAIVHRDRQGDLFENHGCCVVCGTDLGQLRTDARTCGSTCRSYLRRLRAHSSHGREALRRWAGT